LRVYTLQLRTNQTERDAIRNLRHFLKEALRKYHLRCTSIEEVKPEHEDTEPELDL
jgi:hypothetical protein